MNSVLRNAMAVAGLAFATQAAANITFYEREGFEGRSFTTAKQLGNFERAGFNDRASSAVVSRGERWEVCEDARFTGSCVVLRPGNYASLGAMGLNDRVSSARIVDRNARIDDDRYAPAPLVESGNITFYEREGFQGRNFVASRQVNNFERAGFNDRASSVVVSRGERWEICDDAGFRGSCVVLRPGNYPSLDAMGLNDRVSSARIVDRNTRLDDSRYAPAPLVENDYRRRGNERIYEAEVTSVRAVLGAPEQRCWVEREEFVRERGEANVPAAIAGAVIGGILGHQIGGGRGKDIATAGGAVAGAAVGANVGRDGNQKHAYGQNVQRCSSVPSQAPPEYWDVTYEFRGQEYRVQMATAPGRTVRVNAQGEPRA